MRSARTHRICPTRSAAHRGRVDGRRSSASPSSASQSCRRGRSSHRRSSRRSSRSSSPSAPPPRSGSERTCCSIRFATAGQRFNVLAFGALGALFGIMLHGNLLTIGSGEGFLTWVLGPLVGARGVRRARARARPHRRPARRRAIIALGGVVLIGVVVGAVIREEYYPGSTPSPSSSTRRSSAWSARCLSVLRRRPPAAGAHRSGASDGSSATGVVPISVTGSIGTSILGCAVPGVIIGARLGLTRNPDYQGRATIDRRSRAVIFIGPALVVHLRHARHPGDPHGVPVAPRPRLRGVRGARQLRGDLLQPTSSFDAANWTNMFTSIPFIIGVVLLVIAIGRRPGDEEADRTRRRTRQPDHGPLVVGLCSCCVRRVHRVARDADQQPVVGRHRHVLLDVDRARGGRARRQRGGRAGRQDRSSSCRWRCRSSARRSSGDSCTTPRDTTNEQTGIMNALWVGLGRLSTGSGLPTLIVHDPDRARAARLPRHCSPTRSLTRGVGQGRGAGHRVRSSSGGSSSGSPGSSAAGSADSPSPPTARSRPSPSLFVQESPYNNFWLMVILIWIQVGFSMVILSAAIKAVPTELIEAAKIDGATDVQVFWRVTLPQIGTDDRRRGHHARSCS